MNKKFEKINALSTFPDDARVWMFQSNRDLDDEDLRKIKRWGDEFTGKWMAHNQKVKAGVAVAFNSIIVIIVDEKVAPVGGCAQDDMMHFVRFIENQLGCGLLDRNLVLYANGNEIGRTHLNELKSMIDDERLTEDSLVVDALAGTMGDLRSGLMVPLGKSWHKRFI